MEDSFPPDLSYSDDATVEIIISFPLQDTITSLDIPPSDASLSFYVRCLWATTLYR